MGETVFTKSSAFVTSEFLEKAALRKQLQRLTEIDKVQLKIVDKEAREVLVKALNENEWLRSGVVHDRAGQEIDLIDALVEPDLLGDLRHIHENDKLIAALHGAGDSIRLTIFGSRLELKLDKRLGLPLFLRNAGMLSIGEGGLLHWAEYRGFRRAS
jgi:hypothetical protein